VLSMFHIFCGLCKGLFPSFIRHMNLSLMKQSVAPESTSAFVSAIALLVLVCLLRPWLLPKAMNQLVAEEFAYLIARLLVALHRTRFCHRLSPLVLDFDVGSNCVGYCHLACSTYAVGMCD